MKQLFIDAAKLMFIPTKRNRMYVDGACIAIEAAGDAGKGEAVFAAMFKPDASHSSWGWYWMGPANVHEHDSAQESQARIRRVWALLIASVAWKDFA